MTRATDGGAVEADRGRRPLAGDGSKPRSWVETQSYRTPFPRARLASPSIRAMPTPPLLASSLSIQLVMRPGRWYGPARISSLNRSKTLLVVMMYSGLYGVKKTTFCDNVQWSTFLRGLFESGLVHFWRLRAAYKLQLFCPVPSLHYPTCPTVPPNEDLNLAVLVTNPLLPVSHDIYYNILLILIAYGSYLCHYFYCFL